MKADTLPLCGGYAVTLRNSRTIEAAWPQGLVIPHLMRNPLCQRFWIPAFAGMTRHRINFDRALAN